MATTVQRGPYNDEVLIQADPYSVVNRRGDWIVLESGAVKKNYGTGTKNQVSAIGYFSSLMMAKARNS